MAKIGRPEKVGAVEYAMEAQVRIRDLRSSTHPMWDAAVATRDWALISETRAFAATLKVAAVQARRLAAIADGLAGAQRGAGVIADATQPAVRRGVLALQEAA